MQLQDNAFILFQGDSITDAGRSREDATDLGRGYANMIAAWLTATYPEQNLRFINRGISGNRAADLEKRWQADCIDLKPDWVSILIGINDTWRRYDSNSPTTAEAYEDHYRTILKRSLEELNANLIICEPFLLPIPEDRVKWRDDLDPKIAVARKLAREFNAIFVPLDGVFAAAATARLMQDWLPDGVHPTQAGHMLIAQQWLKAVGAY